MKASGLHWLAAACLAGAPLAAAAIDVHRSGSIEVYKAPSVQPRPAASAQVQRRAPSIEVYRAPPVQVQRAPAVRPVAPAPSGVREAQGMQPRPAAPQARIFTKEDFERMRQNDIAAGRTRDSMRSGQGEGSNEQGGRRVVNPDPYNTGGWNYNTNQPASPIWNPNSQ